jgi:hypothetical protein
MHRIFILVAFVFIFISNSKEKYEISQKTKNINTIVHASKTDQIISVTLKNGNVFLLKSVQLGKGTFSGSLVLLNSDNKYYYQINRRTGFSMNDLVKVHVVKIKAQPKVIK